MVLTAVVNLDAETQRNNIEACSEILLGYNWQ